MLMVHKLTLNFLHSYVHITLITFYIWNRMNQLVLLKSQENLQRC